METWGYHLLLDCTAGKLEAVQSKEIIKQFVDHLVEAIDMVAYGDTWIERFATHDPGKSGISMCQMIETSNITGHFVDKDGMKSLYFRNTDLNTAEIDPTKSLAAAVAHFDFQHYSHLTFQEKQDIERLLSRYKGFGLVTQSGLSPKIQNNNDRRTKTLFQLMYWVNLIRSSVLTNSRKPYLGPPLVILTHGMMYMSVPCICESYTISPNEKLGYDTETLLPRVMEVKMNLREVRLRGASHVPGIAGQSRHMPGWDSLYSEDTASDSNFVTIDPFDQTNNIINID